MCGGGGGGSALFLSCGELFYVLCVVCEFLKKPNSIFFLQNHVVGICVHLYPGGFFSIATCWTFITILRHTLCALKRRW